jgi:hypothetical protein
VFVAAIPAKDVVHISRQEVTLLNALYLIPSSIAMVSRKEVLTRVIDYSLEVRYAREPGKKVEGGPTEEDFGKAIHWIFIQLLSDCYPLMKRASPEDVCFL